MFTLPLSPEEEYWVGYMRADGCIVRKPRGKVIIFSQKMREPVDAFAEFVGAVREVRFTQPMTNYGPATVYTISTAKPAYALDELGTKTDLHPSLYTSRHFWRGLLDGDGSCQYTRCGKDRQSPTLCWSGSYFDMEQLSSWIAQTLKCPCPKVGAARSIFRVGINGRKAQWLAEYLYREQYAKLGYKREAALDFKNWVPGRLTRSWQPPS